MTTERLTTLAAVKDWLDIDNDASDSQLTRLIEAASRFVTNYLNWRAFSPTEYTYRFRGNGKNSILLPNWPVISIASLAADGVSISASTFNNGVPGSGYTLDYADRSALATLSVHGNRFCGYCQVVYTAGYRYAQTVELVLEDGATEITVTPSEAGQWIGDEFVTIDAVDAIKVDADPAAGEYAVDEWGTYTFNVADDGKTAVITYAYVPMDLSQATTELIGEWYMRKDRIGVLSKTLGGQETVTFSQKDMNDSISSVFQEYRNVVPL